MAKNICIKFHVPTPPPKLEVFDSADMKEALRLMTEHGWTFKFAQKNILARKYPKR